VLAVQLRPAEPVVVAVGWLRVRETGIGWGELLASEAVTLMIVE